MPYNDRCWRRPRIVLAAATIFLSGCAGAGSDTAPGVCPPVVEYSPEEQARAAQEVARLPEESATAELLTTFCVAGEASICTQRA